ncbi:ATP-binding protein [Nannocystaceae bacterium ST9]
MSGDAAPPASFPGVTGHRRISAMLSRAIARGRLHHGLVLAGSRGIGKATLARGLACALICEQAPALGCGRCDACRRLLGNRHTDLRRLEGEGKSRTIATAAAREVALRAQHAPFEARAHVIVIDPADRMQPAAAAALLKAIEEPRDGVYFVLIASNLYDVLDTILSRCMTIPVERLADADVRSVVAGELARRELEPSDERIELAISLADGSPGVALELLGDSSLEPTRVLLANTLQALQIGPGALFSGDRSPLWSSWKDAVAATPEPGEEPVDEGEGELVVVSAGKGKKPKKASKKASGKPEKSADEGESSSASKESPARQRATAARLAELWLLHLRERLRGREGLRGLPAIDIGHATTTQMQAIQKFQTALARNPNVRLSFEQLLLELGR